MTKVLEHEHLLNLVDLQPKDVEEDDDDDNDEDDDLVMKQDFRCSCDRCGQDITLFHRYYYKCAYSCNYSLHKFCVNLPATLKHTLHQHHTLIPIQMDGAWICNICRKHHKCKELSYHCSQCYFDVDLNCAVAVEEKRIYHPSHLHPLVPTYKPILCECDACGKKHEGIFYQCLTCLCFFVHNDCAFLPKTLLIQQTTNNFFSHPHPLTISYSFPYVDRKARYYPRCRICDKSFRYCMLWIYKCEKCRYYAHLDCATSRGEPFMSIFLNPGLGKTRKNFKDVDHPNLLHLPFVDQSDNLLKHLFSKETRSRTFETDEGNLNHISHQHPLSLVHTQHNDTTRPTSSKIYSLSCHDPMKKIELLCNGCIRPITTTPFYKCNNEDECCDFVLHEWCTLLPVEVPNHPGHDEHALVFLPNVDKVCGVFGCAICNLPCNGFAYGCVQCDYYIDVNCGFIPEKITHEAHPNHLLWRDQVRTIESSCRACSYAIYKYGGELMFSCLTCDFKLHLKCALLLPRSIRHKYDKHPIDVSYFPAENHVIEYFCEICEMELNPEKWFYHCRECVQSIHSACAPLILECERANYKAHPHFVDNIYEFLNIKFGSIHNLKGHPHPLSLVQGVESDGRCVSCGMKLGYELILKCVECKFVIDLDCTFYI